MNLLKTHSYTYDSIIKWWKCNFHPINTTSVKFLFKLQTLAPPSHYRECIFTLHQTFCSLFVCFSSRKLLGSLSFPFVCLLPFVYLKDMESGNAFSCSFHAAGAGVREKWKVIELKNQYNKRNIQTLSTCYCCSISPHIKWEFFCDIHTVVS